MRNCIVLAAALLLSGGAASAQVIEGPVPSPSNPAGQFRPGLDGSRPGALQPPSLDRINPSPANPANQLRPGLGGQGDVSPPTAGARATRPVPGPVGSGFVMRIDKAAGLSSDAPLNLPRDVSARLAGCWSPASAQGRREVTVRLAFRSDGTVIGTPRVTFVGAPRDEADALRASILNAITACVPLRFTPSLGRSIAGRVFAIRLTALSDRPAPIHH